MSVLSFRGFARFVVVLATCLLAERIQATTAATLPVASVLNLYDTANYSEFFTALNRTTAVDASLFKTFDKTASGWVNEAGPSVDRRRIVAASVAIEIAHVLREQQPEHGGQYLVWASLLMRKQSAPVSSGAERWWYLASLAGMEELSQPWVLTAGNTNGQDFGALALGLGAGGHLTDALNRFPNESRFLLTQIEANEYRRRGPYSEVLTPSLLESLQKRAATRVPETPRNVDELQARSDRNFATATLNDFARLADIKRAYQALSTDATLASEIELRVGYIDFCLNDGTGARDHFARVLSHARETFLLYLAEYFTGRTFQEEGLHPDAIAAFERALALVPDARSAATQLARELFLGDSVTGRERAYQLLHAAYFDSAPEDPWRLYWQGDARRWPLYMANLREALK
jgi:tetratricopeptide (TPR) repeat protein